MITSHLLDNRYVIDNTEFDVLISMSDYLIKESYYDEYILEDGENDNNPSFFEKVKGLIVRIWTAISNAFKKLADKIRSLFKKNKGCEKSDPPADDPNPQPTPIDPNAENTELPTDQTNDAQTRINQMEADRNTQALEAQNQLLAQQVQQLTVNQQQQNADFQQLMEGQKQLQQELQDANSKIEQLSTNVENGNNFTDQQIQQLQDDLTNSNNTIESLNNQINQLNYDLQYAQQTNSQDIQQLVQQRAELEKQLQQAQQQQQQINSQLQMNQDQLRSDVNQVGNRQVADHAYFDQLCQDVNNFAQVAVNRANQAAAQTEQLATTVNAQAQTYAQARDLVNTAAMEKADRDARISQLEACQLNINKAMEKLEQKSTTDVTELNAIKQQTETMINQLQSTITSLDQKVNKTASTFDNELTNAVNNIESRLNQSTTQTQTPTTTTQPNTQQTTPTPQPVTATTTQPQQQPQQTTQTPDIPIPDIPDVNAQTPVQNNQQPVQTTSNSNQVILTKLMQSMQVLNNAKAAIDKKIADTVNINNIKTNVVNMIDKAGDVIANKAENLATNYANAVENAGNAIANKAGEVAANAKTAAANTAAAAKNKASELAADAKTAIANKAQDLAANAKTAAGDAAVAVKNKAGELVSNAKTAIDNAQNNNGDNITIYANIADNIKKRFQYFRFYLHNKNLNRTSRPAPVPVIYAYNIPANLFENFNSILDGMNTMASGIGNLLSTAKVDNDINTADNKAAASNKTIVATKNQLGQSIGNMTAALKTSNAMILKSKDFDNQLNAFYKSIETIGASSQKINNLLPVILNAQENNNDKNNNNRNKINNILKSALDGSNYFLKSYQQLNVFISQTVDKYLNDETELQNFYFKNNRA